MSKHVKGFVRAAIVFGVASAPMWAIQAGGRLAATQAIGALGAEASGPLAYGLSLIAIVGSSVSWFRHHHDMGMLAQSGMGTLFVAGVACMAGSLLGFIPGVQGAII